MFGFIPASYKIHAIAAAALLIAAVSATAGWQLRDVFADRDIAQLELSYERGRLAQAEAIARSKDKARAAEAAERTANQQIEVRAHENAKRTNQILAENRRLAWELGGLRDPYARSSCRHGAEETASARDLADGAPEGGFRSETPGFLSPEASEFLNQFAAQCDAAADYAQAGHEYANRKVGE